MIVWRPPLDPDSLDASRFAPYLRELLLSAEEYIWILDARVYFDGSWDSMCDAFADCRADLLATEVRTRTQDPDWFWWGSLVAPGSADSPEFGLAALLPLVRFSRRAAEEILNGLANGWRGQAEAVIPTLVQRAALQVEDIGGLGSFTPPQRAGMWYDHRTWHWKGPVSFVQGMIHFPIDPRDPDWCSTELAPVPVVGFLYLTRADLNHPGIWRDYLTPGNGQARIFAHSKHPMAIAADSPLSGSQISNQIATEWGDISLVQATLELIKAGLEDSRITHFVLVSESCVPAQPLSAFFRSLRFDPRSRLSMRALEEISKAGDAEKARRLESLRGIPLEHAWFQDQWMCLSREDAVIVTGRDSLEDFKDVWAADECYFSTILAASGKAPGHGVINRPVTWVRWRGGAHPREFEQVPPRIAAEIAESGCFFARKFSPRSDIGRWELHLERNSFQ